jgi:basic membrane protein A
MLNAGRQGVIDEIKSHNGDVRHIGNVSDWTTVDDTFIGSAVADSSVAILNAARDLSDGSWQPNKVEEIGLSHSDVVTLSYAKDVSPEVREKINTLRDKILSGDINIRTTYDGQEFNPATGEFVSQSFKEESRK